MAERKVFPIRYREFKGMWMGLADKQIPFGYTNDALNVYGHGRSIYGRPPLRSAASGVFAGEILDMARFRMPSTNTGSNLDQLLCLASTVAKGLGNPTAKVQAVSLNAVSAFGTPVDMRATTGTTRSQGYETRLTPCDDLVWWTGRVNAGAAVAPRKIVARTTALGGSLGERYEEAAVAAAPTTTFRRATWHKRVLFHFSHPYVSTSDFAPSRMEWSDIDNPESYPAANVETVDSIGTLFGLRDGISMGEYLYICGSHGVLILSGATNEDFRMERLPLDYGLQGQRASARVGDRLVAFTCVGYPRQSGSAVPDEMAYRTHDLVIMQGGARPVSMGDRIKPLLDNAITPGMSWGMDQSRAAYWQGQELVVMIPTAHQLPSVGDGTFGWVGTDMVVMGVRHGLGETSPLWRWTGQPGYVNAAGAQDPRITSMLAVGNGLLVGCMDGRIRYFDASGVGTSFEDIGIGASGTTIIQVPVARHWATPFLELDNASPGVEWVDIVAKGSGIAPWTLLVYINDDPSTVAYQMAFNPPPGVQRFHIPLQGLVATAKSVKVRINMTSQNDELIDLAIGAHPASRWPDTV